MIEFLWACFSTMVLFFVGVLFFPLYFFLMKTSYGIWLFLFFWSLFCENSFRQEEGVWRAFLAFRLHSFLFSCLSEMINTDILWVLQDLFSSSAFIWTCCFPCICHLYSTLLFPEICAQILHRSAGLCLGRELWKFLSSCVPAVNPLPPPLSRWNTFQFQFLCSQRPASPCRG